MRALPKVQTTQSISFIKRGNQKSVHPKLTKTRGIASFPFKVVTYLLIQFCSDSKRETELNVMIFINRNYSKICAFHNITC